MYPPMIAISGWSGTGKTTLIEGLVARLRARGLSVGVIKHDAHGLVFDREGKDTWRVREAGAARVEAFDDRWWFQVAPRPAGTDLEALPGGFREDVDVAIVEGGKSSEADKIWLTSSDSRPPPPDLSGLLAVVDRDGALDPVEGMVVDWLERRWRERPVAAVVMADGEGGCAREDVCAACLDVARPVVLCGRGVARPPDGIPCLPPVPDAAGPLAAALAAVRWAPRHAWLVVDPAFPGVERRLIEDLPARRRPGVWAIAAAGGPGAAPGLPLLIEPPAANLLESGRRRGIDDPVAILADHPRFLSLAAPPGATPERGAAPGC